MSARSDPASRVATVRPLLARPFARYACAGDGLCCTDIHALGPVTPHERARLATLTSHALVPPPVVRHQRLPMFALDVTAVGQCSWLAIEEGACRLHANHGAASKPASCRRFPYGLVATPSGGRVTTAHRCPCRTMGERPLINLADAHASLVNHAGRLHANARVESRVQVTAQYTVPFAVYASREGEVIAALLAGDDVGAALGRLASLAGPLACDAALQDTLPPLRDLSWIEVAYRFRGRIDGTACGAALAFFGDAVVAEFEARRVSLRSRPWSAAFDRAETRTSIAASADAILSDWVADVVWGLPFAESGSLDASVLELMVRVRLARRVASAIERAGARTDRAMAEAILIAELGGATALWRDVTTRIAPRESRACARSSNEAFDTAARDLEEFAE
jgi:hypothetical protein